jgi:colicin import membrane protein
MTFRLSHLLAALVLHAVLLSLLVSGAQCSLKPQRPPIITGVLLDPSRQDVARQKREEQRRKAEQEQRRREEEARRKQQAEQQKQRELEQQRKATVEAARRKKEEDVKRQKQAAEQRKAEAAAQRKKEQDDKREREAAEKRETEEKTRMEQAIQEETTNRELAREQAARAASEREVKLAQWAEMLARHVERNWVRPPGAPEDFECTVRVQQLPDGTVTSARIVKSCGNALLDKSVEDAVFRSSPLPKPADPSVFDRDLDFRFIPQS